ncbi:FecR family protein [Chitinophaga varians]|uniref:FecR family protein n=1 Tax=Chitinophaga varians TaxID=2202339 RepID=UPI00165FEAE3|nr:FecR family protein [Chitinophaga varians]MBC9914944.1 FecR domain-containing protein [Chitinophaga varians]
MEERVVILYQKCLNGIATAEEKQELALLLENPANEALVKSCIDTLLTADHALEDLPETTMTSILQAIFEAGETPAQPGRRRMAVIALWTGWAAAAVLAIVAAVWWLRPVSRPMQHPTMAAATTLPVPGYNRATLTLANGDVMQLDSAGHQQLSQGATTVQQRKGLLSYTATASAHTAPPGYNTLTTPRGGQFKIILPDGTTVWLNAASSLHYPLAFTDNERRVEVTGEAFFEVAPDAAKPFRVTAREHMEITVLGTSFNVNAYTDETVVRTTLLSGAVKVNRNNHTVRLQPGQQAVAENEALRVSTVPDVQQVVAWKNGVFDFNQVPLTGVLRQLARWYDIEVVYEHTIPDIMFWGRMGRDLPLQDVLLILEKSQVHCRLENNGKKLIVAP